MAKKSRRARRQQVQKQPRSSVTTQPVQSEEVAVVPDAGAASTQKDVTSPVSNRKAVNFAREYFYVYFDMRNVLIISVLMFVVLIALSFAI